MSEASKKEEAVSGEGVEQEDKVNDEAIADSSSRIVTVNYNEMYSVRYNNSCNDSFTVFVKTVPYLIWVSLHGR